LGGQRLKGAEVLDRRRRQLAKVISTAVVIFQCLSANNSLSSRNRPVIAGGVEAEAMTTL